MKGRDSLARVAAKRAFQIRAQNGIEPSEPCDVYELIHRLGIDLQFCDIPSLEGVYVDERESRRICITSHRPPGRQRSTAAHELGHHLFGHGTRVDEVIEFGPQWAGAKDEEIIADAFGRILLMPPRAVQAAFRLRGVDPKKPTPEDVFRASCWLGVGYTTLLEHLKWTLGLLSSSALATLGRVTPKSLKSELLGSSSETDVWPLDEHWAGQRLHAQVGDLILGLRSEAADAGTVISRSEGADGKGIRAEAPGEIEVPLTAGGKVKISVSRQRYVGFYEYRYLEE